MSGGIHANAGPTALSQLRQKVQTKTEQLPPEIKAPLNRFSNHTKQEVVLPKQQVFNRAWTSDCPEFLRFDIMVGIIHTPLLLASLQEASRLEVQEKMLLARKEEAELLLKSPQKEKLSQESCDALCRALAGCDKDVLSPEAYRKTVRNLQDALDNAYSELGPHKDSPACLLAVIVAYRVFSDLFVILDRAAEDIREQGAEGNNDKLLQAIDGANKAMIKGEYCFS